LLVLNIGDTIQKSKVDSYLSYQKTKMTPTFPTPTMMMSAVE